MFGQINVSQIDEISDNNTHIIRTTKYFLIINLKFTCFLLVINLIKDKDTFNAYKPIKLIITKFNIWCGKIYPNDSNVPPSLYFKIIELSEKPKIKLFIKIINIVIGIPMIDIPNNHMNIIYIKFVVKLVLSV